MRKVIIDFYVHFQTKLDIFNELFMCVRLEFLVQIKTILHHYFRNCKQYFICMVWGVSNNVFNQWKTTCKKWIKGVANSDKRLKAIWQISFERSGINN